MWRWQQEEFIVFEEAYSGLHRAHENMGSFTF